MKFVLVLLLLVLGVVGYLLFGPSGDKPAPTDTPVATQPGQPAAPAGGQVTNINPTSSNTPAAPTTETNQRPLVGSDNIVQNVTDVGGYMMGHTQMMVKKNAAAKLDDINKKHNDETNKLLEQ